MDCFAIVYPYFATDKIQHSFTMEADLDREIDPVQLKTVVQRLCERFPTLFVRLHREKLGYKLEHVHDVTPFIMPRPKFLNMPYDLKNNENLIRITYRGCRLAVECFHSVTDGNGAITLLKSIIAEYFRELVRNHVSGHTSTKITVWKNTIRKSAVTRKATAISSSWKKVSRAWRNTEDISA